MSKPLILVVEDEPLILDDVESELVDAGFDVVTAGNGADAIAAFDRHGEAIRAVITDIRLGRGPSGWDVARHARAGTPTVAVVYVSGDSSHEWASQGVPNSVMVAKPFVFAQLITAVSTMLIQADSSLGPTG